MKSIILITLLVGVVQGGIIVPAYFPWWVEHGQNDFEKLKNYSHEIDPDELIVIINPNNGPATAGWTYTNQMRDFATEIKTFFQHPIGYVYTSFGARDIDEVKEDMRNYIEIYGLNALSGFFIDQVSDNSDFLNYYEELINYTNELFGSCGSNIGAVLNGRMVDDVLTVVQTTQVNFLGQIIPSDESVLVSPCTNYQAVQQRVDEFGVDYYYCTDKSSWNELPSFWDQMI